MNEKNETRNEGKYKLAHINKTPFNYNKTKGNYDIENIIKLKEVEESNVYEEETVTKKSTINNKIYFTTIILIGIIFIFHLFHYFLSEYVRKLFNNNNL